MHKARWALVLLVLAGTSIWAQKPEPQPDANGVYLAGDGVNAPKLVHPAPAVYPAEPGSAGLKRSCALSVVIGADGAPAKIETVRVPPDAFDEAAIAAVKQSEFKPGTLHGKPIPVLINVWVRFLPGKKSAKPELLPVLYDRPPMPLLKPPPVDASEQKRTRFQDSAIVSLHVDSQGVPTHLALWRSTGDDELDEKALEIVSQYRFRPATNNGLPTPVTIYIEVDFRLH